VNPPHRVVAIDGPAASGKSSVARELARRLGFAYVNSGAMYRAVTWHVLQGAISPGDGVAIANLVGIARIDCVLDSHGSRILIDGVDPAEHLCDDRVNEAVSAVSAVPRVREILVEKMRDYARDHDIVMEGRDIGSVVFPDTPYKFYIDASPEVRLRRRQAQGQRDEIAARDRADSSRPTAPLVVAEDAHVIDSSNLTIPEVVSEILRQVKMKGLEND
jgi:cytidylate kinase